MEETQPSSAAAGDYPRWVLLDTGSTREDPSTADARTRARCLSSTGSPVQVSFTLAAPPAMSTLHVDYAGPGKSSRATPSVVAAHRDSVLIRLFYHYQQGARESYSSEQLHPSPPPDLFVYNSGDGANRPPSMSLIPHCRRNIADSSTSIGILSLGGGGTDFVVARLDLEYAPRHRESVKTRLYMLRDWRWELTGFLPVRHHADNRELQLSRWETAAVIPVGDRFLYWIDVSQGIIFSDLTAHNPELWFVPLPTEPVIADRRVDRRRREQLPDASRSVCVTAGGSAVKFVRVWPRCCCGEPGPCATACARFRRAFTFTVGTWTLRTDDMTWEQDCTVHSDEVWAEAPPAIPRVRLEFPVVSLDDPDVICFLSCESRHHPRGKGDKTAWLLAFDMRKKVMQAVRRYPPDNNLWNHWSQALIPSQVSNYFKACPAVSTASDHTSTSRRREDTGVPPLTATRDVEEREISAAIREIPAMAHDEMLRAHRVLAGDDRRMRFLAALPVNMQKEYCTILTELAAAHRLLQ